MEFACGHSKVSSEDVSPVNYFRSEDCSDANMHFC